MTITSEYLKSGDYLLPYPHPPPPPPPTECQQNPTPSYKSTQPQNYDSHENGSGDYMKSYIHTIKVCIHHGNDEIVFVSDQHAKMLWKPYHFEKMG